MILIERNHSNYFFPQSNSERERESGEKYRMNISSFIKIHTKQKKKKKEILFSFIYVYLPQFSSLLDPPIENIARSSLISMVFMCVGKKRAKKSFFRFSIFIKFFQFFLFFQFFRYELFRRVHHIYIFIHKIRVRALKTFLQTFFFLVF